MTEKGQLTKYQEEVVHKAYMNGEVEYGLHFSTVRSLERRGLVKREHGDHGRLLLTWDGKVTAKRIHNKRVRKAG